MRKVSLQIVLFFILFSNTFGQIVLTEIMADPNPVVALPDAEFVELYNTSDNDINLENFVFSDASKAAILPFFVLPSKEYVILCKNGNGMLFQSFGLVIELSDFPSLNNSGDEVKLLDQTGQIIDFLNYDSSYYGDALKSNGGYSLERRNPENYCDKISNWAASNSNIGGSPGEENSLFDRSFFDTSPIEVISSRLLNPSTIELHMNTLLDYDSATNEFNYTFGLPVESINLIESRIEINITQEIVENQVFELAVNNIENCNKNNVIDTLLHVGIPILPQRNDLVINEILFNPETGGSDYVEIYNNSPNLFSTKDLRILEIDSDTDMLVDFVHVRTNVLLVPQSYHVFSEDKENIVDRYHANKQRISEVSLPNYPDESAIVALLNGQLDTLDFVHYLSNYHHPLITIEDGVSLERISANAASNSKFNWTSASSTDNYGSPGRANSAQRIIPVLINPFTLTPSVFSPNNDGINDFVFIDFADDTDILAASILVYDMAGRLVKTIVNNGNVANAFRLRWDGSDDSNTILENGIYIIVLDLFDSAGKKTRYKEGCTLIR